MEELIKASEARVIHYDRDQEYIPLFNELVKANPEGFQVTDVAVDNIFYWIRDRKDMLVKNGYTVKFNPATGVDQSQWSYANYTISYGGDV